MISGGAKCWGKNNKGQLGDGTTTDRALPTDVSGLTRGVIAIFAGKGTTTCALMTGGGVKCWGNNAGGEIGDGTTTDRLTAVDVSGLTRGVTALSTGGVHTCALTNLGGVKCWGVNLTGQLGDGTTSRRLTPVDVSGLNSGVTAVTAGGLDHTCALMRAGSVKCWGMNDGGRLGDGTTIRQLAPVDVAGLASGVTAVAAGFDFTCALTNAGGVQCWGSNTDGQLGDGTATGHGLPTDVSGLTSGATAITTSFKHVCALGRGGGIKCWGFQTGVPGAVGGSIPGDVVGLTQRISYLATGSSHNCGLTESGNVMCWGSNTSGELGDGSMVRRPLPQYVPGLGNVTPASSPANQVAGAPTPTPQTRTAEIAFLDLTVAGVSDVCPENIRSEVGTRLAPETQPISVTGYVISTGRGEGLFAGYLAADGSYTAINSTGATLQSGKITGTSAVGAFTFFFGPTGDCTSTIRFMATLTEPVLP